MPAPSRLGARDTMRSAIPLPKSRLATSSTSRIPAVTPAPLRAVDTPFGKIQPLFDGFDLAETSDWIEEKTPTAGNVLDITHLSPTDLANVLQETETVLTGRGERESTYGSTSSWSRSTSVAAPSKRPASPIHNPAKRRMTIYATPRQKSDDLYARRITDSARRPTPSPHLPTVLPSATPRSIMDMPQPDYQGRSITPITFARASHSPPLLQPQYPTGHALPRQPTPHLVETAAASTPLAETRAAPTPGEPSNVSRTISKDKGKAKAIPAIARPRPGTRVVIGLGPGGKLQTRAERAAASGRSATLAPRPGKAHHSTPMEPGSSTARPAPYTVARSQPVARSVSHVKPQSASAMLPSQSGHPLQETRASSPQPTRMSRHVELANLDIPPIHRSSAVEEPSRPATPAEPALVAAPPKSVVISPQRAALPHVSTSPTGTPAAPSTLPRRFFPFSFYFPTPSAATPGPNQTLQYASPALSQTTADGQAEDWNVSVGSVTRSVTPRQATPPAQTMPATLATPAATTEPERRVSASERVVRFFGDLLRPSPSSEQETHEFTEDEPATPMDVDTGPEDFEHMPQMCQVINNPVSAMAATTEAAIQVAREAPARRAPAPKPRVTSGNFARPTAAAIARAAASKPATRPNTMSDRPVAPLRRPLASQPQAPNVPRPPMVDITPDTRKPFCPPTNSAFASAALARLPKPGTDHTLGSAPIRVRDAERARDLAIKRAMFERAGKTEAHVPAPVPRRRAEPAAPIRGQTPGKASRLRALERAAYDSEVATRAAEKTAEDAKLARVRAQVEAELDRQARCETVVRAHPLPSVYKRRRL